MLIQELAGTQQPDLEKLAALAQFMIGRAQDTNAQKRMNLGSFISIANNMGIAMTPQQLIAASTQSPLDSLILNIEGDGPTGTITFKGADEQVTSQMSVDQARDTVDSMAKRAATKAI